MPSYKTLLLLFALIFVISVAHTHHECNHDSEEHDDHIFEDIEEDRSADQMTEEGRLLASSYPNMRIVAYYDALDSAPSAYRNYIKNELTPPVIAWFEGALRVKYPVSGKLKSSASKLCDIKTPSALKNGVSADFAYLFTHKNEDTGVVASSRSCMSASGTKRPLVGYTGFNRQEILVTSNVLEHEKNMYVVIHEMNHNLGFSSKHYGNFLDNNGNTRKGHIKTKKIGGATRTVIDLPPLTERLRKFYGCSTVPGIIMENNGGSGTAGSHFDRRFFLYEHMCSGGIYGRRVSEFTLAFLEGTGWYAPDYSYAEPFHFGEGQGCGFITGTCSAANTKFDEYCSSSSRQCAHTGRGGGKCKSDEKTEGCKYVNPDVDFDCENANAEDNARLPNAEVYGREQGSKCFAGTLSSSSSSASTTSFCFKYTCSGSGSSTKLQVHVGSSTATCQKEGSITVSGYKGKISCPDPLTFCNTVGKKYCPRNCMNRGSCVSGKCVCNKGFKGIDCALNA